MELISFFDVQDDTEFWPGSVFRITGVGMNVDSHLDFYEYMLINLPWDHEYLIVTNVTHNNTKAGTVLCSVPIYNPSIAKTVNGASLKEALGNGPWYWVKGW